MTVSQLLPAKVEADPYVANRMLMPAFAATLCLSAFLLFSIQPFFAKMLLPRLGGSPAVWSVAMVFFQGVLLLGYGYAHALTRFCSLRTAAAIHAAVLLLAFVVLPIAIPSGWDAPPATGQATWLLGLLAVAVGLPFFAVSANGALLQAWFARTTHPDADDPYFLYGASNIGSFASLILYIVLIEPLLTIPQQSSAWALGYAVLVAAILGCALMVIRGPQRMESLPARHATAESTDVVTMVKWIGLGFIPSGLLVAVTAYITTDVASAPFLWVLPLALFLFTFVLVFRSKPLVSLTFLTKATPTMALLSLGMQVMEFGQPAWLSAIVQLGFFFVAALYCHSILFTLRPDATRLTGFYLMMSLGGVLGGAFASLLAPVAFDWIAEYPLLVLAILFLRPAWRPRNADLITIALAAMAALALGWLSWTFSAKADPTSGVAALFVFSLIAAAIVQLRWRRAYLGFAAALVPLVLLQHAAQPAMFQIRSFFGVNRVYASPDGQFHFLSHGTTLHGAQLYNDADGGALEGKPTPTTYYHAKGGMAESIRIVQKVLGVPTGHFAVVGLGAGSLSCYAQPGETWTFYEIDQTVVYAASDPRYFTFLDCCGKPDIELGDARLTLGRTADASLDYLLVDAFSSDSIPTHLMTREAIELYRAKLKASGLLTIHISNRYLDLESVLAAIAAEINVPIRIGSFEKDPTTPGSTASLVVTMTSNPAILAQLDSDAHWRVPQSNGVRPWTDDYSNIIAALMRGPSK